MKDLIFHLALLCNIIKFGSSVQMRDIIKVCHRKDPQLNKCMKQNLENLRPFLKTGIPELSIPSFTEMCIPQIEIVRDVSIFVKNVVMRFNNLHLSGLERFQIKDLKVNLERSLPQLNLTLTYKNLAYKSDFSYIKSYFFGDYGGRGKSEGSYADIEGKFEVGGAQRYIKKNGTRYSFFSVTKARLKLDFSKTTGNITNTLDAESTGADTAEEFAKNQWKMILYDMRQQLEEEVGFVAKKVFRAIFKRIPYEKFLPLS